ncbi:CfaE/CblD family pilus tip adhesin [Enterobacillus tribolii]|uniref:CblD-like pilus biogenesis initiator n=1 Tax=Enterobacillus tribolii TaxID=1487935 RepID=A0A370R312_9GAMM|nr:CfaE/CblD family pilus tip adhesin [Enterobacillus tribolii]RDK96816.1 CblD-like pilus biogenesis initiator [Enterobacillus tribolii]
MGKIITALILLVFGWAIPLMTAQAGDNRVLERTINRASPGGDIWVWQNVSQGRAPTSNDANYGTANTVVCRSTTNANTGACPARAGGLDSTYTPVKLLFTEKRSGMKVVLTLQGYRQPAWVNVSGCGRTKRSLNMAGGASCIGAATAESFLYIWIPAAELKKLPVGGLWTASLRMTSWRAGGPNNTTAWNADITLNVIDPSKIDIYFPDFSFATPRIALDLHPRGAPNDFVGAYAEDITTLEMCLYDGYNANSTQYYVQIYDPPGRPHVGRPNGDFSIYLNGTGSTEANARIDYHLRIRDPDSGAMRDVINGGDMIWTRINQGLIRPVRLPSISTYVLCVPTPLEFSVTKFNVNEKVAGYYSGTLTVMFSPTTPTVN